MEKKIQKSKNIYLSLGVLILFFGSLYLFAKPENCLGDECLASLDQKFSENENTINIVNENQSRYQEFPEMDPIVLAQKVQNQEIYLLDIREIDEWNVGHIEGANLISLGNINKESTKNLPKDKTIYVYCRSGRRAIEGEMKLREFGFDAKNIGGINHFVERGGVLVK